jgi:hypothetical protein
MRRARAFRTDFRSRPRPRPQPRPRAGRRVLLPLVLLLALLAPGAPSVAHADPLPVRKVGVGRRENTVVVSVGLQDLFPPPAKGRLTSGFATRVFIRIHLRRAGDPDPVAVAFQRAEIVYDLWDEKFRVRVTTGPGTERVVEAGTADQAIAAAAVLWRFPVATLGQLLPGEQYFLAVRGDLNPISQELLAEVRRWMREPSGPDRRPGGGGGDSFFGSFVTVFVNPPIEDSEHQVRFVSQTFGAPTP